MPGTGNFVGEFLILFGSFKVVPVITVISTFGLVFASVYSLIMIHRAYFGPSKSDTAIAGLNFRELCMVLGLAVVAGPAGRLPAAGSGHLRGHHARRPAVAGCSPFHPGSTVVAT